MDEAQADQLQHLVLNHDPSALAVLFGLLVLLLIVSVEALSGDGR